MFIWTIHDVIGLVLIAFIVLYAIVVVSWIGFADWRRTRKLKKGKKP